MKKYILVWATVLFSSYTYAQATYNTKEPQALTEFPAEQDKITWGIKAGWNYNNLYGKERDYIFADRQTDYRSGFHAGVTLDNRLSARYGLQHELFFTHKNMGVMLSDDINGSYQSTLGMQSIDLMPANFTVYTGGFKWYAGPYLSALVGASEKRKDEHGRMYTDKSIFGDAKNDETETRYLQKFDFGVNLGLDYKLRSGFSIGARYLHGFTDIFQYANSYTNEDTKTDNIKIYNRGFMVSIGYSFK